MQAFSSCRIARMVGTQAEFSVFMADSLRRMSRRYAEEPLELMGYVEPFDLMDTFRQRVEGAPAGDHDMNATPACFLQHLFRILCQDSAVGQRRAVQIPAQSFLSSSPFHPLYSRALLLRPVHRLAGVCLIMLLQHPVRAVTHAAGSGRCRTHRIRNRSSDFLSLRSL